MICHGIFVDVKYGFLILNYAVLVYSNGRAYELSTTIYFLEGDFVELNSEGIFLFYFSSITILSFDKRLNCFFLLMRSGVRRFTILVCGRN